MKILPFILVVWCSCVSAQTLQIEEFPKAKGIVMKRGMEYTIRWADVRAVRKKIVLVLQNRSGETVQNWETFTDDGEEVIKIPSKLKPQKGYKLTMNLVGEETEFVKSVDIRIRRRVPLAVTLTAAIVPVAAAGVFVLLPMLNEPDPEEEPEPIDNL